MQRLDAINETSYLSVPNAPIYRKIMRLFYREYEKMHFQLYKEDVYELVKGEEEFAGQSYGMAQLEQDLDALVKWKNLTPIQDPGRVYTIADYKNRQYRYTMSEYAVEIERMTVRLENLFLESGNLSTNFFIRLERSLEEAEGMEQAPLKEVNEWWNLLQEDFKRLNQNYQDYPGHAGEGVQRAFRFFGNQRRAGKAAGMRAAGGLAERTVLGAGALPG